MMEYLLLIKILKDNKHVLINISHKGIYIDKLNLKLNSNQLKLQCKTIGQDTNFQHTLEIPEQVSNLNVLAINKENCLTIRFKRIVSDLGQFIPNLDPNESGETFIPIIYK